MANRLRKYHFPPDEQDAMKQYADRKQAREGLAGMSRRDRRKKRKEIDARSSYPNAEEH